MKKKHAIMFALWAIELEWGGISGINKLTSGKSMTTIRKGIKK